MTIEWASRVGVQFDIATTEDGLFACKHGHKKLLWAKLTAKINLRNGFLWFNKQGDLLARLWNGLTPDVQGEPHLMHEHSQGSRSQTRNPYQDTQCIT